MPTLEEISKALSNETKPRLTSPTSLIGFSLPLKYFTPVGTESEMSANPLSSNIMAVTILKVEPGSKECDIAMLSFSTYSPSLFKVKLEIALTYPVSTSIRTTQPLSASLLSKQLLKEFSANSCKLTSKVVTTSYPSMVFIFSFTSIGTHSSLFIFRSFLVP